MGFEGLIKAVTDQEVGRDQLGVEVSAMSYDYSGTITISHLNFHSRGDNFAILPSQGSSTD